MGTKNDHGKFDCYDKALPDEPMFILLARDPSAPNLIEAWAVNRRREVAAGERPASDLEVTDEAVQCAFDMRSWRIENNGKWRHQDSEPLTPPMITWNGVPAPANYEGGAVLCFNKNRVACIFCRINEDQTWPEIIEHNGLLFYPYGDRRAPSKYATRRGESVRTAL